MHNNRAICDAMSVFIFFFVLGWLLRYMIIYSLPCSRIRRILLEFVIMFTMCCSMSQSDAILTVYGNVAYFLVTFFQLLIYTYCMRGAAVNPCIIVSNFLNKEDKDFDDVIETVLLLVVDVLAIVFSWWALALFLEVGLGSGTHSEYCKSALNVSPLLGFVIESIGMAFRVFSNMTRFTAKPNLESVLKCFVNGFLIALAAHTTGYFTNPAMASFSTLGCKPTCLETHFVVYWIGPMAAAVCMTLIHPNIADMYQLDTADQSDTEASDEIVAERY